MLVEASLDPTPQTMSSIQVMPEITTADGGSNRWYDAASPRLLKE